MGLNAAIRVAQGSIIIRLDAHTKYAPDYIRQCLAVLQETGADNVGGPCIAEGKGFVSQAIAAAFHSPFAVGGARWHDLDYVGAADTVHLGCWRREVFDRIGLFDEELVRNQDDEFNLRLTRAGGKIWHSPRIKSWYRPRESLRALIRQYMQYGYWKVRVIQKHKMPASVRHLIPGGFVLLLICATAGVFLVASCGLGLARIAGDICRVQRYGFLSSGSAPWVEALSAPSARVCLLPFLLRLWLPAWDLGLCHTAAWTGSHLYGADPRRNGPFVPEDYHKPLKAGFWSRSEE